MVRIDLMHILRNWETKATKNCVWANNLVDEGANQQKLRMVPKQSLNGILFKRVKDHLCLFFIIKFKEKNHI